VSNVIERVPDGGTMLSTDAIRLAEQATGGPALWFLWKAGSGQDLLRLPPGCVLGVDPISVSSPGRSIEYDAWLFEEAAERWREVPSPVSPRGRRTSLGRRLDEIRKQIKASDQPLLSWEDIDRELSEQRGEGSLEEGR
jgi:hypothetical protein